MKNSKCEHERYEVKHLEMIREVCTTCGQRTQAYLPQIDDMDVTIESLKHGKITLGELIKKDRSYFLWLATDSHYAKPIRNAALRILEDRAYVVKEDGFQYNKRECFKP